MQLLVGFIIAICALAWSAEDILHAIIGPKTPSQAAVASQKTASTSGAASVKGGANRINIIKPQVVSDAELLEIAKTDPQAAARLYQQSLMSVQIYEEKGLDNYLAEEKYDPKTLDQSLKNAVAKINSASEEAQVAQADPSKLPPERKILHEPTFRETVKSSDLQTAFQQYHESYEAVQRTEFKKLQEFLETGKYE